MTAPVLPLLTPDLQSCCTPAAGGLTPEAADRLARVFKALSDPSRVRLLSMIAASPGAEACICDLTAPLGLSQPTVSHHMKQLTDAGLVSRDQRGRWAYFSLVDGALGAVGSALQAVATSAT